MTGAQRLPLAPSGRGSAPGRAALLLYWVGFIGYVLTTSPDLPPELVLMLSGTGVVIWILTAPVPEPLSGWRTWITLVYPVASALVVTSTGALDPPHLSWLIVFTTGPLAFLALRGRAILACTAFLAFAVGLVGLALWWPPATLGLGNLGSVVLSAPALMGLALLWRLLALRVLADVTRQEQAAAQIAAHRSHALATMVVRRRELERVLTEAGPLLNRLAAGQNVNPDDGAEAAIIEARLRDRIRSPRLTAGQLSQAVDSARRRGVTVLLLDDGDQDRTLEPAQLADIASAIEHSEQGQSVTVRLRPPGRSAFGTVFVTGGVREGEAGGGHGPREQLIVLTAP